MEMVITTGQRGRALAIAPETNSDEIVYNYWMEYNLLDFLIATEIVEQSLHVQLSTKQSSPDESLADSSADSEPDNFNPEPYRSGRVRKPNRDKASQL